MWVALGANLGMRWPRPSGARSPLAGPAVRSRALVADSLNEGFRWPPSDAVSARRPAPSLRLRQERSSGPARRRGHLPDGPLLLVPPGHRGVRSEESESLGGYVVGLVVLVVALLAEGTSLLRALSRCARRRRPTTAARCTSQGRDDPTLRTVLAEDSTACLGVLLAISAWHSIWPPGTPSTRRGRRCLIGALLVYVAYILGKSARAQLIGEAAAPEMQQEIRDFLDGRPEVDAVTAAMTMRLGPDSVMLAARVDLVAGLDSEEVEEALVRTKQELRERWPELDQLFLDVTDASVADRVRARRAREDLDDVVEERRQTDAV